MMTISRSLEEFDEDAEPDLEEEPRT